MATATLTAQKKHPAWLTPEKIRELSELADKIDREEAEDIKKQCGEMIRRQEQIWDLIAALCAERLKRKLSLEQVGEESEIGAANLCRLESNVDRNPTLDTVLRYADALGLELSLTLKEKSK